MTQFIYSTTEELAEFFFELDKRSLGEVDIISGGKCVAKDKIKKMEDCCITIANSPSKIGKTLFNKLSN